MLLGIEVPYVCMPFEETMAFARVARVGRSGIRTPWQLYINKGPENTKQLSTVFLTVHEDTVRDIDIHTFESSAFVTH